jgi:hypothetical protein
MSQFSTPDVVNLFKRVYGDLQNLLPEDYPLAKDIPFASKQKVGEKYIEAVALSYETGITFGGSSMVAFEINPAIAGAVQQAEVTPYSSVLASLVPWGVISRSAGGGDKAFFDATKYIVKNNLRSHGGFLEDVRLYGQATKLLGYVSYYTGTYRGSSLTNGTGTVNSISFTNGINAASKAILFNKGNFAAGIWVGKEGAVVQEVNASGTVVQEGKLVSVNPDYGYITVDFTPTAASSLTSHRMKFKGMGGSEALGLHAILSNTSTLFGIATSAYSLWQGNTYSCSNQKFSLTKLQAGVAQAVGRGGLDGDLMVYVNPRTWANLVVTEAGLRKYDSSYSKDEAQNGFEAITFYHQTGKATIKAHRKVMEGDAFALHLPDWSRSGSAEISFTVPGMDKEVIYPVENMAAYAFRSYSDQYLFNHAPARSILFTDIDDESAS